MKKLFLLAIPLLAFCILLPQTSHAMKVKKFKHAYYGTWVNTYDSLYTPGYTGDIEIKIKKIKKSGKITDAHVWFDNTGTYMQATGAITKANGVKTLSLIYQENGWEYDYYTLYGTITAKTINGYYDHYTTYYDSNGYSWGGTIALSKNKPIY